MLWARRQSACRVKLDTIESSLPLLAPALFVVGLKRVRYSTQLPGVVKHAFTISRSVQVCCLYRGGPYCCCVYTSLPICKLLQTRAQNRWWNVALARLFVVNPGVFTTYRRDGSACRPTLFLCRTLFRRLGAKHVPARKRFSCVFSPQAK